MFRKLRNRLIFINFSITTFIVVAVFAMIYLISTKSAENRPLYIREDMGGGEMPTDLVPDEVKEMVMNSVREEKQNAASNLLLTLVLSGTAIEIAVVLVSYFLAEEAIKPVKEAYEAQKIFIANASHEIKTPLASISANLEAADIHGNKWIDNVVIETDKLTSLNNELLALARTDLMAEKEPAKTNLSELVLKVIDRFEPRLSKKNLARQIETGITTKISAEDFEQIFSILLDNAVKYSKKNITVKLTDHSLEVSNDGAKISSDKLPHIFDRFYQVDKSKDGVGLGLAIAKSVAEKNHWKLTAKSVKNTTFILAF